MSNEISTYKDSRKFLVYNHTNKINNKIYIGITSLNPNIRWSNGNRNINLIIQGELSKEYHILKDNLLFTGKWNDFKKVESLKRKNIEYSNLTYEELYQKLIILKVNDYK